MSIDSHPEVTLPGWTQVGHMDGYKYGTWVKQLEDGTTLSIQQGSDSRRYWLRIGNCYYGNYATPKNAAKKAKLVLKQTMDV